MYNQDQHLCRMCDEEPAVYNGMCSLCLYGEEKNPDSGKFQLRHNPNRRPKRNEEE
jgi:hypothetical protein